MSILIGSTPVNAIRIGSTPVNEVRIGSTLVWSSASALNIQFDSGDTDDLTSTGQWVDEIHTNAANLAGIFNGTCRIDIPDGLIAVDFRVSKMRYSAAQTPEDDGWIETVIAGAGEYNFISQVFRRLSNDSFDDGVGIQMVNSALSIVRRVAGVDTVMEECGAFNLGDRARLTQTGNVHTMTRNGEFVGEWDDVGATAASGPEHLSLGLSVSGAKPPFFGWPVGPRLFSPALDYIRAA